ncbi:TPA: hypothetical protein DCY67_03570 [Candidatus Acetothermia bacterium]|nr:hypothetical protein [Candidatus Acetothermia bacterium]
MGGAQGAGRVVPVHDFVAIEPVWVEILAAELGLVGTLDEWRGRGLQRRMVAYFRERMAERGAVLSIIQGIPGFYRQFGYVYAIPLEGGLVLAPRQVPPANGEVCARGDNRRPARACCSLRAVGGRTGVAPCSIGGDLAVPPGAHGWHRGGVQDMGLRSAGGRRGLHALSAASLWRGVRDRRGGDRAGGYRAGDAAARNADRSDPRLAGREAEPPRRERAVPGRASAGGELTWVRTRSSSSPWYLDTGRCANWRIGIPTPSCGRVRSRSWRSCSPS